MKNIIMMTFLLGIGIIGKSQDWRVGGNNVGGNFFQQTIGTNNNFPFRIETANQQRTKLNANVSYAINGYFGNKSGYLLLGDANRSEKTQV